MDVWLSFMAVGSTFVYLGTVEDDLKRALHTAVALLTALMVYTKARRYLELMDTVSVHFKSGLGV